MITLEKTQMIIDFMPLANSIVRKNKNKLPKFVDIEELQSVAYLGLVDAANKFDTNKSPSFYSYAKIRIFGEIQDYLRNQCRFNNQTHIEDFDIIDKSHCEKKHSDFFEEILKNLNETDKDIVESYYIHDLSLKQIGAKFGLSESRISQKLTASKQLIKNQMAA